LLFTGIVGTVVNCEGGQDSFAFATVLPYRRIEKVAPLKAVLGALSTCLTKALSSGSGSGKASHEGFQALLDCLPPSTGSSSSSSSSSESSSNISGGSGNSQSGSKASSTGILLHKRFTNLPIQLVGALHRNLEEDISWAQQQASDEDDEEKSDNSGSSGSSSSSAGAKPNKLAPSRNFFADARHVILLSECSVMGAGKGGSKGGTAPVAVGYSLADHACHSVLGSCSSDIVFECFEDEVYLQHATAAVLFRPPKQHCTTDLVALLVPISKLKTCVNGICALVPDC
jgi:hypothetical protein